MEAIQIVRKYGLIRFSLFDLEVKNISELGLKSEYIIRKIKMQTFLNGEFNWKSDIGNTVSKFFTDYKNSYLQDILLVEKSDYTDENMKKCIEIVFSEIRE